jgi:antitoxin Phd
MACSFARMRSRWDFRLIWNLPRRLLIQVFLQKKPALKKRGVDLYVTTIVRRSNSVMRKIQLKDAKARLSAVVDDAVRGQAAVITRHGKPEAVVLSFREWERLAKVPTFGQLLMSAPLKATDLSRRNRPPLRRIKL